MTGYFAHDPDAGPLPYSIDFAGWLADGDGVASVTWSIFPTGPDIGDVPVTGAIGTCTVAGGTRGYKYRLTGHVTSTNGAVDQQSITLQMGQK